MFDATEEAYLLRQLSRANVVLFVGAGFSTLADNRLGQRIPAGSELAEKLWSLLPYTEPYTGEPLDEVYEAILDAGVAFPVVKEFLEAQLLAASVPALYQAVAHPLWYRIYTTNIDNVLDEACQRARSTRVEIIAHPRDDIRERDAFLDRIQHVYLNGKLPCRPDEITFSPRQYARASLVRLPLYEQFVRDYINHPTIFVGTRFNEPLFWRYLEEREERERGISEQRPGSFLITRRIPPTKRAQLAAFNIKGVEAGTDDFSTG